MATAGKRPHFLEVSLRILPWEFARKEKWKAAATSARVDIGAYERPPTPVFANSAITVPANAPANLAALTGPSPAGGTLAGVGVNSATGVFDPSGRALGNYTLTSSVNDGFGGANSATFTLTLLEAIALVVSTALDAVSNLDGVTSLRESLVYAHTLDGPQAVTFAPALSGQTVTLSQGWIDANDSPALRVAGQITVEGPATAPGVTLAIASGVQKRHFYVEPSGALTLVIARRRAPSPSGSMAVWPFASASLTTAPSWCKTRSDRSSPALARPAASAAATSNSSP